MYHKGNSPAAVAFETIFLCRLAFFRSSFTYLLQKRIKYALVKPEIK